MWAVGYVMHSIKVDHRTSSQLLYQVHVLSSAPVQQEWMVDAKISIGQSGNPNHLPCFAREARSLICDKIRQQPKHSQDTRRLRRNPSLHKSPGKSARTKRYLEDCFDRCHRTVLRCVWDCIEYLGPVAALETCCASSLIHSLHVRCLKLNHFLVLCCRATSYIANSFSDRIPVLGTVLCNPGSS